MSLENPMTFVRSIKGAPASVLWALIFSQRPMTGIELAEWTAYHDDYVLADAMLAEADALEWTSHSPTLIIHKKDPLEEMSRIR